MVDEEVDEKWEVADTEEPEEEEQDVLTYQISYFPADFTLKGYVDKWDSEQLEIPPFQRSYVWDQVKASKLIESFLLGLPVPGVFLYKVRETNKLQVIDGQQRIISAVRFFKNEFDEKIFRLKNVHPKWDGKTYNELDEPDRFQLDDTVLRATIVQQLDPEDDSSIYHIFERLNTGGMNLNPMEIRKCVYYGDVFTLLEEINKLDDWRNIIGKPKTDKRLRDVELILRILALLEDWDNYEKPMKGFLNRYMAKKRKLKGEPLMELLNLIKKSFTEICKYVYEQLGEKPFHLRGRLNYAVMDSVMVMADSAIKYGIDDFSVRFNKLIEDEDFIDSATKNTSDETALTLRFLKAREFLAE